MEKILDGKITAQKIRKELKLEVDDLKTKGINPKLAVIMIGNNSNSIIYLKNKSIACDEIGILYEEFILKDNIVMEELIKLISQLNKREDIHGILLQSPIPSHLDINIAMQTISPQKDVDGFHPYNTGKLLLNQDCLIPCTPYGVLQLLKYYQIDAKEKHAVIIGRSNMVGKPMAICLLNQDATVTICHSKTVNLEKITTEADILVCAVGKEKFIKENMIKEGAVIIDIGINRTKEGKIVGDVDFKNVYSKASYITPVPGGVGPMTITMLMKNIVKCAKSCF